MWVRSGPGVRLEMRRARAEGRGSGWEIDGIAHPYRRACARRPQARRRLCAALVPPRRRRWGGGSMTGLASDDLARELRETGYCIVPDLMPTDAIGALDADLDPVFAATPFGRGDFYGHRTKRFGALMKRSAWAQALALEPPLLAAVERSDEHTSELQSLMRISY